MKNQALKSLLLTSALVVGAFATTDSAITQRNTLLQNLKTMDFSNPGVLFTGEMYGGAKMSNAEVNANKTAENQAYTEAKVVIQARPTAETYAQVNFRAMRDWQSAYEAGFNPILVDWWSYNGKLINDRSNFALGDMRVFYSPLTLATPTMDIFQEPLIFTQRRERALDYRNLDNTEKRLMQGLNFELNSGAVSAFDNLFLQGTVSRLRNQAKKQNQIFYDYDFADRYLVGTRAGFNVVGLDVAANFVYSFNRERSAENFVNAVIAVDTALIEKNRVVSAQLGYNIWDTKATKLNVNAEVALSNYLSKKYFIAQERNYTLSRDSIKTQIGGEDIVLHSLTNKVSNSRVIKMTDNDDIDGTAINFNVTYNTFSNSYETDNKLTVVLNDIKFESEMAQSPIYLNPMTVLNSKGLSQMGIALGQMRGNLESMYNYIYETQPLNSHTLTATDEPLPNNQLLNNYKLDHFTRNGYTNQPLTRAERMDLGEIDPGMDIALPYGVGTPDRQGAVLTSDWLLLNQKSLEANVRFAYLQAPEGKQNYLTAGLGLGFDLGAFLGWENPLKVSGAFEMTDETKGSERKAQRMAVGIDEQGLGVKGLGLHIGFQRMAKEGKIAGLAYETVEDFLLAGPAYEITTGTRLVAQYGLLTQTLKGIGDLKITRHIAMGEIQMKF